MPGFDPKFPQPSNTDNSGVFEEKDKKELEIQNKLIEEGKKYGNDFRFVTPAIKSRKSELPEKINPKIFDKEIHPNYLKTLESQFNDLKKFISAPIIKDSFAKDNYSRRDWENKYFKLLDQESQECYKSNRLGLSNALQIVSLLNILRLIEEDSKGSVNQDVLTDLENAAAKIPEAINGNSIDSNSQYINLSDEEKIKALEDLASVVETFLKILGESKKAPEKQSA